MSKDGGYQKGTWNGTCDICGLAFKFTEMVKCWDNSWRDRACFEPRNPLDFVRAVRDDPSIPVARPRTVPSLMNIYQVVQNDTISHYSTQNSSAISITGDFDFIARISMANWSTVADTFIFAKSTFTRTDDCYFFDVSSGFLQVTLSPDGTNTTIWTSTAVIGGIANQILYLKASYVKSTGTMTFSKSTDGATYAAIGVPVVAASTAIFTSALPLLIGINTSAPINPGMKIYSAQIYNGVGGTLVGSFVASDCPLPGVLPMTSFNSVLTGEKYTPINAAFITGIG